VTAIWVLVDPRAGTAVQALGVADALGLPFEEKKLHFTPLAALPNALRGASRLGVEADIAPPWPEIVISAGRRSAPLARWIKRQAKGQTKLVHIMDPGPSGREEFDLIAIPHHDGKARLASNMLGITGAPHRLTPEAIKEASALWQPRFAHLKKPLIGLLVGGSTRKKPFTTALAAELGRLAAQMSKECGGTLLVTTSRRTDLAAEQALFAQLPPESFIHNWREGGENPYRGFLAVADGLIVTGDSMSMASEASANGGPVFIYAPTGSVSAKHARLHEELYALGYALPLEGKWKIWSHPPLNAAFAVANVVKKLTAKA
jgi:mitochondrial fission protein ELM1